MTTTATTPEMGKSAARTHLEDVEPVKLRKRIGSTTFIVNVHFSNKSKKTLEDKVLRLMECEVEKIA